MLAADPMGIHDRRPHGDRTKQDLLYARVFCGLLTPWWLFRPRHYRIVGSDSCCRRIRGLPPTGLHLCDGPVFDKSITGDDLRDRSNSSPGGISAWRSCWDDGPRPARRRKSSPRVFTRGISGTCSFPTARLKCVTGRLRTSVRRELPGSRRRSRRTGGAHNHPRGHSNGFSA